MSGSTVEKNIEALSTLLQNETNKANIYKKFGKRHIQVFILTCFMIMAWIIRTILTVSIVAMTTPLANASQDIPRYNWTDKSLIMSSFLWGYVIPQFSAGYAADRYGAKWLLVCSTSITAVLGILIPVAASTLGSKGVMACRTLQGLSQGFLYPSMAGVLGKWLPSNERSLLATCVYSGGLIGVVVAMTFAGYISASSYGWPYAFYLSSGACMVVIAIYAYVGVSDPSEHPTITEEEKRYIQTNLKTVQNRHELQTPFKEMFTSPPFLALIATNVAFNYTHWTFITETAIYMDKVMDFDLKSNSLLSSLPYLGEFIVAFLCYFIGEFLSSRNILSTTMIRRIMNNIGMIVPAIALYFLGNTGPDDVNFGVALIIAVSAFHGTEKSGHLLNHMDLAPNFSGLMMGVTNGIAIVFSMFAPIITQFVVTDETNRDQWKIIFYLAMGLNIFATTANTFFTSGELQPWSQGTRKIKYENPNEKTKVPVLI